MKTDNKITGLLDYKALAKLLGLPVGTIHAWVHNKKIPHYRLGPRLVRFDAEEIQGWLRAKYVTDGGSDLEASR